MKVIFIIISIAFFQISFLFCQSQKSDTSNSNYKPTKLLIDSIKFISQKDVFSYLAKADTILAPKGKNIYTPFDKLTYNKIIAYDYEGSHQVTMEKEKFYSITSKLVYNQKSLNQNQVNFIVYELTNKKNYGNATAACFEPHMALVFYKDTTFVNSIDICMDCNFLISTYKIPTQFHNKVNEGKEDEYTFYGFTNKGKRTIKKLSKELGFNYANFKIN
ncbi:MAG: hypothetical protein ACK5UE_13145 [Chitinophagales bacterium]|jgi:hypothetical protein|nr:hypothetical protein [Sphingobacteriales bacterium]